MALRSIMRPKFLVFMPLVLVLMIAVACGEDATPVPQATQAAPTLDVAAIQSAVQAAVEAAIPEATEAVTAEQIQDMVQAAVGAISTGLSAEEILTIVKTAVPEGASVEEIQGLVETAVAAAAQPQLTKEEIAALVSTAVKAAAEGQLTAGEVQEIVKAAIPPTATPVPTPQPSPTPGFMTSSVERLIVAALVPAHDTNLPWKSSSASFWRQEPMYDFFIQSDPITVKGVPGLAARWEASTDATDWTLELQKGVPFHKGLGEFTAKDAVHSYEMYVRQDAIAPWSSTMKGALGDSSNIEVVNDHEIIMHLLKTDPELDFQLSYDAASFVGLSADYWEATGRQGQEKSPIGTGSWKFKEDSIGEFVLYERVENHWRKTPEFKELMLQFVGEHATRLAMLLTGEAHITDLTDDLLNTAEAQGKKVALASSTGHPIVFNFTGIHFATPDKLDADNPFLDIRVREAFNRAWNREEVIEELYSGRASAAVMYAHHPSHRPWDPTWAERWPEMYGYDPERARQLLAEAGYPNGFKVTIFDFDWGAGTKELNSALAVYLQDIGLDVELSGVDYAVVRDKLRDKDLRGPEMVAWPPTTLLPLPGWSKLMHKADNQFVTYEHDELEQLWAELDATADITERDRIYREVGEHLFTNYAEMPMVYVLARAAVDPEVVGEFYFTGSQGHPFSHFEYIVAAQ